jgi:hypothetical protein
MTKQAEEPKSITCESCGYKWTPRVENPVACPECKARLGKQGKSSMITSASSDLLSACSALCCSVPPFGCCYGF